MLSELKLTIEIDPFQTHRPLRSNLAGQGTLKLVWLNKTGNPHRQLYDPLSDCAKSLGQCHTQDQVKTRSYVGTLNR